VQTERPLPDTTDRPVLALATPDGKTAAVTEADLAEMLRLIRQARQAVEMDKAEL
jgi:phosphoglycerate dehydrogenase-like enzyme